MHIRKQVNGEGWFAFHDQVDQEQMKFEAMSYQDLLRLIQGQSDDLIWRELELWMMGKFAPDSG